MDKLGRVRGARVAFVVDALLAVVHIPSVGLLGAWLDAYPVLRLVVLARLALLARPVVAVCAAAAPADHGADEVLGTPGAGKTGDTPGDAGRGPQKRKGKGRGKDKDKDSNKEAQQPGKSGKKPEKQSSTVPLYHVPSLGAVLRDWPAACVFGITALGVVAAVYLVVAVAVRTPAAATLSAWELLASAVVVGLGVGGATASASSTIAAAVVKDAVAQRTNGLHKELGRSRKEQETLRQRVRTLQAELTASEKATAGLEGRLESAEEQRDVAEAAAKRTQQRVDTAEAERKKAVARTSTVEDQLAASNKKAAAHLEELAAARATLKALEGTQKDLRTRTGSLSDEKAALGAQLAAAKATAEANAKQAKEAEQKRAEVEKKYEQAGKDLKAAERAGAKDKEQAAEALKKEQDEASKAKKETAELKATLETERKARDVQDKEHRALQDKVSQLEAAEKKLSASASKAKEQETKLTAFVAALESECKTLKGAEAAAKAAGAAALQEAEDKLQREQDRNGELQQQLAEVEGSMDSNGRTAVELQERISELSQLLEDSHAHMEDMEEKHEEETSKFKDLFAEFETRMLGEKQELVEQLAGAQRETEVAKKALAAASSSKSPGKKGTVVSSKELREAKQAVDKAKQATKEARDKLRIKDAELQGKQDDLARLETEKKQVQALLAKEKKQLEAAVAQAHDDVAALQSTLVMVTQELDDGNRAHAKSQESASLRIKELEDTLHAQGKSTTAPTSPSPSPSALPAPAGDDAGSIQTRVEELERELKLATRHKELLQSVNSDMQTELVRLKQRAASSSDTMGASKGRSDTVTEIEAISEKLQQAQQESEDIASTLQEWSTSPVKKTEMTMGTSGTSAFSSPVKKDKEKEKDDTVKGDALDRAVARAIKALPEDVRAALPANFMRVPGGDLFEFGKKNITLQVLNKKLYVRASGTNTDFAEYARKHASRQAKLNAASSPAKATKSSTSSSTSTPKKKTSASGTSIKSPSSTTKSPSKKSTSSPSSATKKKSSTSTSTSKSATTPTKKSSSSSSSTASPSKRTPTSASRR